MTLPIQADCADDRYLLSDYKRPLELAVRREKKSVLLTANSDIGWAAHAMLFMITTPLIAGGRSERSPHNRWASERQQPRVPAHTCMYSMC